jgi:hypothetical protein
MNKLEPEQRALLTRELNDELPVHTPALVFSANILRVLLSIDARLADTNDFYLQNQEERNRPNG